MRVVIQENYDNMCRWAANYIAAKINAHKEDLGVPLSIGVGGTLDVMAGVMKRAPRWMQKAKLEWLFRGMLQPKRAGRLLALPKFVFKVHAYKKKR